MSANVTGDYYTGADARNLQREHYQLIEAQEASAPDADGGT